MLSPRQKGVQMTSHPDSGEQLDAVIADYLKRLERGELVERARFLQAHRSLGTGLTTFFDDYDRISQLIERHELEC